MCKGQISADLCQPPSYDGSGSPGKPVACRTAEAISEERMLLDGTTFLSHPALTVWRSVLTETAPVSGSYLQFIRFPVREIWYILLNSFSDLIGVSRNCNWPEPAWRGRVRVIGDLRIGRRSLCGASLFGSHQHHLIPPVWQRLVRFGLPCTTSGNQPSRMQNLRRVGENSGPISCHL